MVGEYYQTLSNNEKTEFVFLSEGPSGVIPKGIIFTRTKGRFWNLAFGDIEKNGRLNDSNISNNQDIFLIMSTVASAVHDFFEEHPNSILEIHPVDEKRKRLYNLIFSRRWGEIETLFFVWGKVDSTKEIYSPEKFYDSFEVAKK